MVIPPFMGLKLELRGHFVLVQFHSGSYAADAHKSGMNINQVHLSQAANLS